MSIIHYLGVTGIIVICVENGIGKVQILVKVAFSSY